MAIKKRKAGSGCKVSIEGEFSIYEAVDMGNALKKYLEDCESMDIDLQSVTELDTAGVQILLALKKQAVETNKQVNITMHSEKVVEVFELLNIAHEFGDPIVLSGQDVSH